ncbi:tyrosine protein phosphatase PTP2 KNAG_0A03240 [Huiozyma naganishii CBS 8797]|uniref:Uncharacterized protein n=1 Tax=Huiozyma naganishii (strain ATCC MYA-139 / BCRC 22969 / CBS 8797 / KCTC 17520 / NBRC 10181 / NCYC 3082 / Yp74L-3) TaxID=1071383 RepID=J7S3J6_HUIN7|nr:hypothetical protein KNAG_0A03240 [Kazachstania naganishii CBS 8797]CCK68011.1 hypothetical protein KNAG_0A03240 [Kazachstania naganishii CBS 8797]
MAGKMLSHSIETLALTGATAVTHVISDNAVLESQTKDRLDARNANGYVDLKTSLEPIKQGSIIFNCRNDVLALSKLLSPQESSQCEILQVLIPLRTTDCTSTSFDQLFFNEANRDHCLNLLLNCYTFYFFDGESTLSECNVKTFQVIEQFYSFVSTMMPDKVPQMNMILLEKRRDTYVPKRHRNFNLTIKLPEKPKQSSDAFVQSIKQDFIPYTDNFLRENFRLPSLLRHPGSFEKNTRLPNWLQILINNKDELSVLNYAWKGFTLLEQLELDRIKSCFPESEPEQFSPITLTSKGIKGICLMNSKGDFNIYSLSSLQRQYKHRKKKIQYPLGNRYTSRNRSVEHLKQKPRNLRISIPLSCTDFTSAENGSPSSSDSEVLQTPYYEYKIDKAIQSFSKNRYFNILPYEHSRVKLANGDDYLNANYLEMPQINSDFRYIATQAPLENTIHDFWQMVHSENVKVIVSLNSTEELKLKKWNLYWNDKNDNIIERDVQLITTYKDLLNFEGCTLRIFQMNAKGSDEKTPPKTVYHLQYSNWLDSCGIKIQDFLLLYKIKNHLIYNDRKFIESLASKKGCQYLQQNIHPTSTGMLRQSALLVHCSAGCGRTGVFITLDFLLNLFQNELNTGNMIDVWNMNQDLIFIIVNELRRRRLSMVQNFAQYITCYDGVIDYFTRSISS